MNTSDKGDSNREIELKTKTNDLKNTTTTTNEEDHSLGSVDDDLESNRPEDDYVVAKGDLNGGGDNVTTQSSGDNSETVQRFSLASSLAQLMHSLDNKQFKCCCNIQFSVITLLSLIALLLNIVVMIAIVAIEVGPQVKSQQYDLVNILSWTSIITPQYFNMKYRVLQAVNDQQAMLNSAVIETFYTTAKATFVAGYVNLTDYLHFDYAYMNGTRNSTIVANAQIFEEWEYLFNVMMTGEGVSSMANGPSPGGTPPSHNSTGPSGNASGRNSTNPGNGFGTTNKNSTIISQARNYMASSYFQSIQNDYENAFLSFVNDLKDRSIQLTNTLRGATITNLVLICISLALIIPFAILILFIALAKTRSAEKKFLHSNTLLLFDTMSSSKLKPTFKVFCQNAHLENNFNLLEKTRYYVDLSKTSIELQSKTFDILQDVVNKKGDFSSLTPLQLKQFKQTESSLKEIEIAKSQVAFDIIECANPASDVFVTVSVGIIEEIISIIDKFNIKADDYEYLDVLPHDLFEALEEELAPTLVNVHTTFKRSSEFASLTMN